MAITSGDVSRLRHVGELVTPGWARMCVKRSGRRPLLVIGRVLLEARSNDPNGEVFHAVTIMETSDGAFAYAVEQGKRGANVSYAVAETVPTLQDAVGALRDFDPSLGLCAEISLDGDTSAQFSKLTAMKETAQRDYAETLSQIIENASPSV